jgi:hypothetical protein
MAIWPRGQDTVGRGDHEAQTPATMDAFAERGDAMSLRLIRLVVGIAVVLGAWTVGRVQGQSQASPAADFHILIRAPEGRTSLYCARGCIWKVTEFECSNSGNGVCGSAYNADGFVRSSVQWPEGTTGAGS